MNRRSFLVSFLKAGVVASAAVLVMSLGAAVIGILVLGFRVGVLLGWRTITVIDW